MHQLHTFRGESLFSTWLNRVTTNCVLMRMRRQKNHPVPDSLMQDGDTPVMVEDTRARVDDATVANLLVDRLRREMPPGQGRVLLLHDLEGYTHVEIGAIIGTSTGNTKAQLFHARRNAGKIIRGEPAPRGRRSGRG